MEITCISDLHGFYPKLEGGDLLIIAGDLTARDEIKEYLSFHEWVRKQKYKKIILVGGNHDNRIHDGFFKITRTNSVTKEWLGFEYLEDSGTKFEGLRIWGSPWTKTFEGMNPHCKAFTCDTEEELDSKFSLIPDDIDILITHSPPASLLDKNILGFNVGSSALMCKITNRHPRPQLWIWGHIHESYGEIEYGHMKCVNASHVNERYQPINMPISVII